MSEQTKEREVPQELGFVSAQFPGESRAIKKDYKEVKKVFRKSFEREVKHQRAHFLPGTRYGAKGAKRANNMRGDLKLSGKKRRLTSYNAAVTYPFTASSTFGIPGVCLGEDKSGAGGFFFDPWEFYNAGVFKGMAMTVFGVVGQGKSTLVKSFTSRQVQIGRRASVMSDRKGEWDIVAAYLGGVTIRIGSGQDTRINPLDEGNRPSKDTNGAPMTDEKWAKMVRQRRFALLRAIAEILKGDSLDSTERLVLSSALATAVQLAESQGRVPIIPDVVDALDRMRREGMEEHLKERKVAIATMHDTFLGLVSAGLGSGIEANAENDISGMFDGESTVQFDVTAPIVTFNTSGLEGLSSEARKIAHACIQTWAEAAITSNDFGKRLVIYEEGLEVLDDIGSLNRMIVQYKLARHYGIFNILVLHKLTDLNLAGDEGSKARAAAFSLLGDSPIRVIYRQEAEEEKLVREKLGLTAREWQKVSGFSSGRGLWKLGDHSFEVQNTMTAPERPVFDTNKSMGIAREEKKQGA